MMTALVAKSTRTTRKLSESELVVRNVQRALEKRAVTIARAEAICAEEIREAVGAEGDPAATNGAQLEPAANPVE